MKVTSKGQVTIPKYLRAKTGMLPGTEVDLFSEGDRVCIQRVPNSGRGEQLLERMRGRGNLRMSTDEIMALTRGE
jgi:AbrB family looped-hinge helix DNA binding protein